MSTKLVVSNNSLISRINEVESITHRQSTELKHLNKVVKKYKNEIAQKDKTIEELKDLVVKIRFNSTWTMEAREYIDNRMAELGIESRED